ncbi:hypothetical protein CHLNCDRAFT_133463 [Chlorella variabilis]|uniref:Fcf2 pre-rRNA processing C-terminal domain-containing protein n=1 Tax=Chlorella variabilis TaxID=554065 RepID=E1Z355_CHLVA|nr:hypothetical protein CHLNCDRAFT_133463 [Chlorella variabilis]EFN59779.1 hypothetical protein CHLNCDRAFT_133463 [Chlorella variabilis]|eukprot:XP_005851881.1 hypothetical protein CHLNCDRAFT_133463 [Chlorella variabilis]
MVSTRSQSVLSAEAAHGDTAASHGEVSSVAPTPRRSGRLRSSGTAATPTAEQAPPRTARTRRLRAIIEEQEQQGDVQEQQAEQQQEAAPGSQEPAKRGRRRSAAASPKSPAAGAASPAAAEEPQEEEEEQEKAGLQPLKARVALVDLLAEEMFAALNGAFGEREGGSSTSGSDEESGDAQEEGGAAARPDRQQDRAAAQADSSSSDGSDSDSEGEGRAGRDHVPRHLRWRPELTLPGMPGSSNQPAAQPGRGEPAAAAAAAMAAGVHVVRKGKQADSLHVPPPDERAAHRAARKAAPDTAGAAWFDLPATQITDEVKRDLRLLRLRGALDPKSFYKKLDSTKFPKYFQMGTVVEGAADFYSGRLTNKQRKRTFTEEIMADEQLAEMRKKRHAKLQEERQYWSKKKMGRKTSNERKKKAHHRPKH